MRKTEIFLEIMESNFFHKNGQMGKSNNGKLSQTENVNVISHITCHIDVSNLFWVKIQIDRLLVVNIKGLYMEKIIDTFFKIICQRE